MSEAVLSKLPQDFKHKLGMASDYWADWSKKSGDTIADYNRFLEKFFYFCHKKYGVGTVEEVTPKMLTEWMKYLRDEKKNAGSSINLKRSAVLTFFKTLYNVDPENEMWQQKMMLFSNIKGFGKVEKIQHPPIPPQHLIPYKDAALQLDKHYDTTEHYTFFMLLLYTGGRSQFYGLTLDEINFEKNWIETKVKGEKEVKIPLHSNLKKVLLDYHLPQRGKKAKTLFRNGRYPYVPNSWEKEKRHKDHNRKYASNITNRIKDEAGIEEIRYVCQLCRKVYENRKRKCKCGGDVRKEVLGLYAHRFRETLHYYFEELGVSENTAMAIGGWTSEEMQKLYSRKGKHVEKAREEFEEIDLLGMAAQAD